MAEVHQLYTVLNDVARQAFGKDAVEVTDISSLVSLGNVVLKSNENTDLFVRALTDRIGKTVIGVRRYDVAEVGMIRHAFEYGIALQKIYVDLPDTMANDSWRVGEDDYEPQYAPVIKPTIRQKLFSNASTFDIDITLPDNLLRTAFTTAEGMAILFDAVFVAVDNRMKVALESCVELTRASFIARKINGGSECGAINVLKAYNEETGSDLKAADAKRDKDFLKYLAVQLRLWQKRMERMSVLFNEEGYKRHTPKADCVFIMLDEFDAAISAYLDADTFHNELLALPRFSTVPYWQGSGTDYSFDSTSSIKVTFDGSTTVEADGIIGVMYDIQAMGITWDMRAMTTERNNRDQYTNYYSKVTRGYFNDMSENGIVFYIADPD